MPSFYYYITESPVCPHFIFCRTLKISAYTVSVDQKRNRFRKYQAAARGATEVNMRINRSTVNALLSLDDDKLAYVVGVVLREAGIGISEFGISDGDIAALRARLSELSDGELAETERMIDQGRRKGGNGNGA